MSTLQVANVHFESTGANRIEYTGNNVVRVQGKGLVIPRIDTANTPSPEPGMMFYNTSTNNMVMMANTSAVVTIPSNTVVDAAFAKANAALANASGTFAGNLGITGNLGAGNTSPVYKLDVDLSGGGKVARFQSSAGGDPYITVEDNTGAISYMFQNRGSYGGVGSLTNNGFAIRTINTDRIYIGASGDVGVGTMAEAGNTLRYFDLQNSNTGSSAGVITRMITSNSTGTGITTVDIVKYKNGLFVINNNDPAGTFTFNNAGAERMRITSGGNVGIGTTAPAFTLDVAGTIRALSSSEGIQTTGDTIGRDLLAGRSNVATCIGYAGGSAMVQGTNFSLSATPDLSLQPYGGNVGVGTTSPITKLDVEGIGRFLQTASPTTGAVIIRASSGDTNAGHLQFVNNSNSAQYGWIRGIAGGGIAFGSADSTERMRITSGGILGIGTNSPSYTVDAQGTGDISARFKTSSGGAELLLDATNNFNSIRLFNSGTEKWRAGQVNSANYTIYDSPTGTSRLIIDTSGRVTIPYQPAFYANGAGGNYTLTNGADIVFGGTRFNTGNHYNTTNGRFTAPVAGVYCFHWSTYVTGATGRCSFKINGGDISGQQLEYSATQSQSMTVYLNAGDYVTVGDWQSISGGSLWLGHSQFSGHLVG